MDRPCEPDDTRWVSTVKDAYGRLVGLEYYFIDRMGYPTTLDKVAQDEYGRERLRAVYGDCWYCVRCLAVFSYWHELERHLDVDAGDSGRY